MNEQVMAGAHRRRGTPPPPAGRVKNEHVTMTRRWRHASCDTITRYSKERADRMLPTVSRTPLVHSTVIYYGQMYGNRQLGKEY